MIFTIYLNKLQYLEKGFFIFLYFISLHLESILLFGEKKKQKMAGSAKCMINLHLCFILLPIFEYVINIRQRQSQ